VSTALEDILAQLDAEVRELEELPHPQVREQIFRVLQLIDHAHRPGLEAVRGALQQAGQWQQVLEDEGARILFTLYDLAPMDERTQAEIALEAIRPYIRSHGGEVEVLRAEDGEVHVRLSGACGSCAASASTLERGVRAALQEGLPGFSRLVAFAPAAAPERPAENLVQLSGPVFSDLLAFADLADRTPLITEAADVRVLVVRVDDQVYAFEPTCAACGSPLEGCTVSRHALVCPLDNCAFDVRSGRRIDGAAGASLGAYPVTVREARVLLATDLAPAALFAGS